MGCEWSFSDCWRRREANAWTGTAPWRAHCFDDCWWPTTQGWRHRPSPEGRWTRRSWTVEACGPRNARYAAWYATSTCCWTHWSCQGCWWVALLITLNFSHFHPSMVYKSVFILGGPAMGVMQPGYGAPGVPPPGMPPMPPRPGFWVDLNVSQFASDVLYKLQANFWTCWTEFLSFDV